MAHFRIQNSALLCVSGRATSKPENSSYLSTWYEIKQNNQITYGSSNFFNLVQRMKNFSNKRVQKFVFKCYATEWLFAHPENVLISMIRDDKQSLRNVGVAKVLPLRKPVAEESANNNDWPHALNSSSICLFGVPTQNLEPNANYELASVNSYLQQPLAIATLQIEK